MQSETSQLPEEMVWKLEFFSTFGPSTVVLFLTIISDYHFTTLIIPIVFPSNNHLKPAYVCLVGKLVKRIKRGRNQNQWTNSGKYDS